MQKSRKLTTKKLVTAALMAALVCVATMVIQIPSPMKGYLNLGDGFVLFGGWLLGGGLGCVAAGLGSALADLFSGYLLYAPATFVIKGAMAFVAFAVFRLLSKRTSALVSQAVGGLLAELLMVFGYFGFEGCLYGFPSSALNLPANIAQGIVGLLLGVLLGQFIPRLRHLAG